MLNISKNQNHFVLSNCHKDTAFHSMFCMEKPIVLNSKGGNNEYGYS